ncbi:PQ-loop-domain-containing protein [Clavulina sp. PMI_390]|nr:PQ-loop-domain-containing protein [Clavulina sp. PMI_390]
MLLDVLAYIGPREEASNVFGWLSIGCWLIVYSPQIYENYSRQSGEGLSVAFVVIWLLGDLFSLGGAVMAKLIPTVIVLALYYTLCDITLLFQIYYYRIFYNARSRDLASGSSPSTPEREPILSSASDSPSPTNQPNPPPPAPPRLKSIQRLVVEYALLWAFVVAFGIGAYVYDRYHSHHSSPPDGENGGDVFEWRSQLMGWLSAALYLGSRIPQIKKNTETRCEGLSLALFMFAIAGNLFYVLSICVLSMEWSHMITNASWLVGSGGCVFLDFLVLGQFFYFRRQDMMKLRGQERAPL